MQEEVTQKTVTFCIRTTKVTADLLKKVLAAYLRHQKQKSVEKKAKKNQPKQGKVTVKELAKQNAGMVIEKKGYQVVTVSNGADAIEQCRQQTFDLILLDEMMPGDRKSVV